MICPQCHKKIVFSDPKKLSKESESGKYFHRECLRKKHQLEARALAEKREAQKQKHFSDDGMLVWSGED